MPKPKQGRRRSNSLLDTLQKKADAKKQKCTICERKDRAVIDKAYRMGKATGQWGINNIANEVGVHWNTLRRHFSRHLGLA